MAAIRPLAISEIDHNRFENLAFDLLWSLGVKNLVWRTPGSDGGRDLEGITYRIDITGNEVVEKWHIECKRYTSSVDWPTVWQKLAYAQSHDADFLLLFLSSQPSPQCEDEIQNWNSSSKRPTIRIIRGHEIQSLLRPYPLLRIKYGLQLPAESIAPSLLPVHIQIMQLLHYISCAIEFGEDFSYALDAAISLSEFSGTILSSAGEYSDFSLLPPSDKHEYFDWVRYEGSLERFNDVFIRALVSSLRFFSKTSHVTIACSGQTAEIAFCSIEPLGKTASDFLGKLAIIADVDFHLDTEQTRIALRSRIGE